jgi:hypothetical protein
MITPTDRTSKIGAVIRIRACTRWSHGGPQGLLRQLRWRHGRVLDSCSVPFSRAFGRHTTKFTGGKEPALLCNHLKPHAGLRVYQARQKLNSVPAQRGDRICGERYFRSLARARYRDVLGVARIRQHQHHRAVGIFGRGVIHARHRSGIRGCCHS